MMKRTTRAGTLVAALATMSLLFTAGCSKKDEEPTKPAAEAKKETKEKAEAVVKKTAATPVAADAKLLAVKFHSDFCGSCKAIGPIVDECVKDFAGKPIQFVTLDFTSDETKKQVDATVAKLGIGDAYAEHGPKTGHVVLIDAKTKKIVGTLTKKETSEQWHAEIERLLDNS